MRGIVYRTYEKGVRLEANCEKVVARGDFNLNEGPHPVSGQLERQAILTEPGKGVVARLSRAEVVAVAGFGISIAGFELSKVEGQSREMRQEWWFVPTGHEG
jgi:hypothetical protein